MVDIANTAWLKSRRERLSSGMSNYGSVLWRKVVPGTRVTLPAQSILENVYVRKKLTQSWRRCLRMLWLSRLDGVDPAEQAKVFVWRNVGPAGRVTLPFKKGDPPRLFTLLAERTFCFSWKRFAKFCKEMLRKAGSPQGNSSNSVTLLPGIKERVSPDKWVLMKWLSFYN